MTIDVTHVVHGNLASDYFRDLAYHDDSEIRFGLISVEPLERSQATKLEAKGIRLATLGARGRGDYPRAFLSLTRILKNWAPDIVNTHLFDPSLLGLTAAALAGTPVRVMTRHYSDLHHYLGKRLHTSLDRYCANRAHLIIANSEWTRQVLTEMEGVSPDKVRVIHYGVDFEFRSASQVTSAEMARSELEPINGPIVTIAGRLHPVKGHEYLIRALPIVAQRSGELPTLLVAGEGPELDRLRGLAESLGVSEVVRFLGFRKDVDALFSLSDIVVVPSLEEAFGQVLVEAMHMSKPVIASRIGGIPEIVEDGVTGVLVEPASTAQIADALVRLLLDPDERQRMGTAGRERAHSRFHAGLMARSYEATYREAMERVSLRPT